jgi:hypothetical protein
LNQIKAFLETTTLCISLSLAPMGLVADILLKVC